MTNETEAWEYLAHDIRDTGDAIVLIRATRFLASPSALFIGAALLGTALVQSPFFFGSKSVALVNIAAAIILAGTGVGLLIPGWNAYQIRKANGGVHPTDILYILKRADRRLYRKIDGAEEFLADFANVILSRQRAIPRRSTKFRRVLRLSWKRGDGQEEHEDFEGRTWLATARAINAIQSRIDVPSDVSYK